MENVETGITIVSIIGTVLGLVAAIVGIRATSKLYGFAAMLGSKFPVRDEFRGEWKKIDYIKYGLVALTDVSIGTSGEYLYLKAKMLSPVQIPWTAFSQKEVKGKNLKLVFRQENIAIELPHESLSTGAKAQLGLRL